MSFKKYNRKIGLTLSFLLLISTLLSVLVIPLPIAKADPAYSWSTFTVAASGDDVEYLAKTGFSNYTTNGDNLWVHSNEYTTYAWLRFEGLSSITDAGGIIDQVILSMYSGADEGADYNEVPGGYVSVAAPMYSWDFELTEENILAADMNPIASFDGDDLSPSGAWYNKTISNNDPRDWYAWSTDFNDVFTCYVAGFMQYSPDWTYYRSFTSYDEGHPAKLYVKYHIGEGYEAVLSEFGISSATYVQGWYNYNIWKIPGQDAEFEVEYVFTEGTVSPYDLMYDNITEEGPIVVATTESNQVTVCERRMARTSNGTLFVVYFKLLNTKYQIYIKKSMDGGTTWIGDTHISTYDAGMLTFHQVDPCIAVDSNDNLHVTWSGATAQKTLIWYRNYTTTWGPIEYVSTKVGMGTSYDQTDGYIALDSNDVPHIIWHGKATGFTSGDQIWYTNYTAGWIENIRVSTYPGMENWPNTYTPSIAVDSDDVKHIVWAGRGNGLTSEDQIFYSNSTWDTPEHISTYEGMSTREQANPFICIGSDDKLHVTWEGKATGFANRQIWYINRTTSWTEPVRISTYEGMQTYWQHIPSNAIDEGDNIHVVWSGAATGYTDYDKTWYAFNNGTWFTPVVLQPTGQNRYPNLRWGKFPEGISTNDTYVATDPDGNVITPDPYETPEEVLDFVKDWDALYGPACSFNWATLYEADGVTVNTDGWLFMGEVYVVKAEIRNFTTFYLELDDGKNKVLFNYVNATKSLNVEASEFVAGLVQGTVKTLNAADEVYELAWKFILNKNILDVPIGQNITYFGVNTPQESHLSGTAITGLMIYNLGGHVTYEFQGDAGRRIGGDALEVHHTNSTGNGAYVDVMFRKMQHVHLAFSLDVGDNDCFDHDENSGVVYFGFKYWNGAAWDTLYYAEMSIVNGAVDPVAGDGKAFIIPYVSWNSRQSNGVMTLMKSDTLSGYPECADDVNSQITYSKFYLDLWFNTMNSSTTVGGRISTKYFGMDESTSWFFWSNWKPVMVNQTESMFFDDLRDSDGDILQISDIDLVKFYIRVLKTGAGAGSCDSHTWGIVDPEFSKTLAADRMQAINTPEGIETLVLDMPSSGFLQPLAKAIQGIGNMIWAGALNFVKILIASMDTIFLWVGFPAGTFSQISNWVLTIPDFMLALIGHFGDILTNMITQVTRLFAVIAIGVPQLIYGTGVLVTTITAYMREIISLFTGGWSGVSDLWSGLSLAQWLEVFVVAVLPFMWLQRLEGSTDAFKTAREDIGWVFGLLFSLVDLGSWLIQTIGTILQAIRNILPI